MQWLRQNIYQNWNSNKTPIYLTHGRVIPLVWGFENKLIFLSRYFTVLSHSTHQEKSTGLSSPVAGYYRLATNEYVFRAFPTGWIRVGCIISLTFFSSHAIMIQFLVVFHGCSLDLVNSSLPGQKWPPFGRRWFQMHFREWKKLCFDLNFIEFFPKGPIDNNLEMV